MTSKGHALSRDALIRTLTSYSGITTADGAEGGTTLVDSNLKDNPYISADAIPEKTILIMSGDARGEDKGAESFDGTDTITLQAGFSAKIKAGTVYRILNISSVEMDVARIEDKIDALAGGAFWGSYGPRNVEVDNDVDFGIMVYDPSGNIITTGEITPGTYTVHRIRVATDTEIVGSTASEEAAGRVYMTYNFPAASWAVGDIFYITFSGIKVTIDTTTTEYPNLYIWGRVVREADISAVLGALDTAAATGAVSDVKKAMAYLKELVTGLALDGSAPFSYNYTKGTVPGWLHGFHMVRRILFVVPEALASGEPNTVHNVAIKAELDKMGLVETITQADALTYPDYESITLTVLGSPLAGTAWTTSNLAHIKAIFGLPVVCVDAIAAAYLKMGTDGGNAATKTVLNAIANIEASILGTGIDDKVGLAAGANTVAASGVTFSTLDMSDEDITEIWYGWETTEDNTDVLLAEIRKTMPDATPGKDLDGADVPGTLAFYGCAYSMDGLNTLGKTVFHLLVEKLLHSSTAGLAVLLSGEVGNLAAIIGNRATPAAEGAVTTTDKLMAYVKQLVTELIVVDGIVDDVKALVDSGEAAGPYSYIDDGGEQDVVEDTAVTRRRIWLEFSNRNMTQIGTFKIYRKVDGANYDLYVTQAVTVGAGDDRAWDAEFTTNQAWKLTYEEGVDETAARDIPYNVITQVVE